MSWTALRRAEEGPESEFYNLSAVLGFVQAALFNDPDYEKRVIVRLGKGSEYLVVPSDGPDQRTVLAGRSLRIERVALKQYGNENRDQGR